MDLPSLHKMKFSVEAARAALKGDRKKVLEAFVMDDASEKKQFWARYIVGRNKTLVRKGNNRLRSMIRVHEAIEDDCIKAIVETIVEMKE